VKMRRCEDEKMRYRPPLLEEPCAQTLSGKTPLYKCVPVWEPSLRKSIYVKKNLLRVKATLCQKNPRVKAHVLMCKSIPV